jgi:hypothetical protein
MKGELLLMTMTAENQSSEAQVHVTLILGADKALLITQFKYANHARQKRGGAVLTIHQPCDRGERGGSVQSTRTHNQPQLGFPPLSGLFFHRTGFPKHKII